MLRKFFGIFLLVLCQVLPQLAQAGDCFLRVAQRVSASASSSGSTETSETTYKWLSPIFVDHEISKKAEKVSYLSNGAPVYGIIFGKGSSEGLFYRSLTARDLDFKALTENSYSRSSPLCAQPTGQEIQDKAVTTLNFDLPETALPLSSALLDPKTLIRLSQANSRQGIAPGPTFSCFNPVGQILGSALEFDKLGMIPFIKKIFEEYGQDGSPVRIPPVRIPVIGTSPTFLVTHPNDMEEIHQKTDIFQKGESAVYLGTALLGKGISVTESNEEWKKLRHLIVPSFGPKDIASYVESLTEITKGFLDRMEKAKGETRYMEEEMTIYATQLNSKIFLNKRVTPEEALRVSHAVRETQVYLQEQQLKPLSRIKGPCCNQKHEKHRKALAVVNDFAETAIIEDQEREKNEAPGTENGTLIRKLRQTFEPASTEEANLLLRDQVKNIYFGGMDAPAHFMVSGFLRLAQNPEIQKELRQEIQNELGDLSTKTPEEIANAKLPHLANFLDEVLRMDASGPVVPRDVTEDYELNGYKIPKGSKVILSYHFLHRLPEFWEHPDQFDPSRFARPYNSNAFKPFGGGRRMCVAPRLNHLEGKLLFTHVLASGLQFNLKPNAEIEMYFEGTYHYRNDVPMIWSKADESVGK